MPLLGEMIKAPTVEKYPFVGQPFEFQSLTKLVIIVPAHVPAPDRFRPPAGTVMSGKLGMLSFPFSLIINDIMIVIFYILLKIFVAIQGPLLLTWFNINSCMDK